MKRKVSLNYRDSVDDFLFKEESRSTLPSRNSYYNNVTNVDIPDDEDLPKDIFDRLFVNQTQSSYLGQEEKFESIEPERPFVPSHSRASFHGLSTDSQSLTTS